MKSPFRGGVAKRDFILLTLEGKAVFFGIPLELNSEVHLVPYQEERPALTLGY